MIKLNLFKCRSVRAILFALVWTTSAAMPYLAGLSAYTEGASSIFSNGTHALFIDANQRLWSAGYNLSGQLGDGTLVSREVPVIIGSEFISTSKGSGASVGLKQDGSIWTWGNNALGLTGLGTFVGKQLTPAKIAEGFKAVSSGRIHMLALHQDGSVWSWGLNEFGPLVYGQLGLGDTTARNVPTKVGEGYIAISGGGYHSLALKSDGSLWAWGSNTAGQLGDGTKESRTLPTRIGEGYVAIAAGDGHSAAIKQDGSLWTWGFSFAGGAAGGAINALPRKIGEGYQAVRAGIGLNVALKKDGQLLMWGGGDLAVAPDPKPIGEGFATLLDIAGGLKTDGSLWLWGGPQFAATGSSKYGRPGSGFEAAVFIIFRSRPTQVGADYIQVAPGNRQVLALRSDGSLWAWGINESGQLGDGTTESRYRPVPIAGKFTHVVSSKVEPEQFNYFEGHSLALQADGSLWAWGGNTFGQLGLGDRLPRLTPTPVGNQRFRSISAGAHHSLGIKEDDTLWAWGDNQFGRLGDGTEADKPTPVQVGSGFVAVKAQSEGSVGIKRDGSVWIWGNWPEGGPRDGPPCSKLPVTRQYLVPTKVCDGLKPVNETDYGRALIHTAFTNVPFLQAATPAAPKFVKVLSREDFNGFSFLLLGEDGSLWQEDFRKATQFSTGNFRDIQAGGSSLVSAIGVDNSLWVWGDASFGQIPIPAIPYFTVPRHSVILDPPETRQTVCLFDWAQAVYPTLFFPPGNLAQSGTDPAATYYFRAFPGSQSFLGVAGGVLYYLGPASNNTIARIGLASDFLERAACD